MPAAVIAGALLDRSSLGPRFDVPIFTLNDSHKIQQLTAANRIVNHVPTRTHPIRSNGSSQAFGQTLHRDQASPGHAPREIWPVRPEQLGADTRMDAVRADQDIAGDALTALKRKAHAIRVLLEADAFGVQV